VEANQIKPWSVYMLRCRDGSLYTGIAKDVPARIRLHTRGRGAAYTRGRLPVSLVYQETSLTHSEALIREAEIKRMPRPQKEALVLFSNPR
jgi:putative endonuclease